MTNKIIDETLEEITNGLSPEALKSVKEVLDDFERMDKDEILQKKVRNSLEDMGLNKDGVETEYGRGYREGTMSLLRFAIINPEKFRNMCTAMALTLLKRIGD